MLLSKELFDNAYKIEELLSQSLKEGTGIGRGEWGRTIHGEGGGENWICIWGFMVKYWILI